MPNTHTVSRRRWRCRLLPHGLALAASAIALGACAPRDAAAPAALPTATASAEPSPPPPKSPQVLTREAAVALLDRHFRAATEGRMSVELEPSGRLVKRGVGHRYEEEVYLRDIAEVVYAHDPSRDDPHVIRAKVRPGGVTRFRRGDEAWNESKIPHVSFPFRDKHAADEAIEALRALMRP